MRTALIAILLFSSTAFAGKKAPAPDAGVAAAAAPAQQLKKVDEMDSLRWERSFYRFQTSAAALDAANKDYTEAKAEMEKENTALHKKYPELGAAGYNTKTREILPNAKK